MRVTVIDIEPAELAAIRQALGLDVIQETVVSIDERVEQLMANFDQLNTKIDEVNSAVADAAQRVSDDVQNLQDTIAELNLDAEDQAKVDAAVGRLTETQQQIASIDPIPAQNDGENA